MRSLKARIKDAGEYLREKVDVFPSIAIILGTGLGGLTDKLENTTSFAYTDIPHFPGSTVESHKGQMIIGKLSGKPVIVMAGRWHYYEGYTAREITFPIRVLRDLGVENLIITNVSGGLNENYEPGSLVVVSDHINLMPDHPLRGPNDESLGPRFPDMLHAYDKDLQNLARKIARVHEIEIHSGVYTGLQGPSLETPAEYNFVKVIGGDLVGMSTIPEVIVANHSGMKVLVISMVSNVCYPIENLTETTVEEVIAVAEKASPKLEKLIREIVHQL